MLKKLQGLPCSFFVTCIGILDFLENYDKIEGIKSRDSSYLGYLGK